MINFGPMILKLVFNGFCPIKSVQYLYKLNNFRASPEVARTKTRCKARILQSGYTIPFITHMNYPKLTIIGAPGSGETYLANHLGAKLNLPAYDLDGIFWDRQAGH
jgi:hypothetical protein